MRRAVSLFMLLLGAFALRADIPFWTCYGGSSIEWILSGEDVQTGSYSAKMADPASSTYKILYQSAAIDGSKSYTAEVWVKNYDYTSSDYVKLRLGFNMDDSWLGNSFKTYYEINTTVLNTWVKLRINSVPAGATNHYAKIGLYVHYPSPGGSYRAYWDNVRLFSTDNTNVNLIVNHDFETTTGPSGGSTDTVLDVNDPAGTGALALDRRIFSPGANERVRIDFLLPYRNSYVVLRVYDLMGSPVRDLFVYQELKAPYPSQSGTVWWDGRNNEGRIVRTGAYLIYMEAVNSMTGEVTRQKRVVFTGKGQ